MSGLRMLMSTLGCLLGLLIWTVAALVNVLTAPPVRVDFAFDTGAVSVAIDPWTIVAIFAVALLGGLLGWMVGLGMTRSGWTLTRLRAH